MLGAPLLDNRIVGALFVLTALVADIALTARGSTAPALVMSVCTAGLGMLVGPVRPLDPRSARSSPTHVGRGLGFASALLESRAIGAGLVLVCFGGDVWLTLEGKTVSAIVLSVGLALLGFVTTSVWPLPSPPDPPDAA